MSLLPNPRRAVTGHDKDGNAIFVEDSEIPCVPIPGVNCNFAVLYETHEFPSSNDVWEDPIKQVTKNLANKNGVVLRVVDFKPKTKTASSSPEKEQSRLFVSWLTPGQSQLFHRTESLDFGIIFSGEIVCYLDNGVELLLKAGDVCVQRGTIHGWDNRSDEPCRLYFILSASKPVSVGDKVLGEVGFSHTDVESGGQ